MTGAITGRRWAVTTGDDPDAVPIAQRFVIFALLPVAFMRALLLWLVGKHPLPLR